LQRRSSDLDYFGKVIYLVLKYIQYHIRNNKISECRTIEYIEEIRQITLSTLPLI